MGKILTVGYSGAGRGWEGGGWGGGGAVVTLKNYTPALNSFGTMEAASGNAAPPVPRMHSNQEAVARIAALGESFYLIPGNSIPIGGAQFMD